MANQRQSDRPIVALPARAGVELLTQRYQLGLHAPGIRTGLAERRRWSLIRARGSGWRVRIPIQGEGNLSAETGDWGGRWSARRASRCPKRNSRGSIVVKLSGK